MKRFDWKEEYDTGVQQIDYQHRYFLQLIKGLSGKSFSSVESNRIQKYVDEVACYARFHFLSEENVMEDSAYPEFRHHEQLHRKLVKKINHKIAQLEFGDITPADFVAFLAEWFVEHTMKEDKKIGVFLKERRKSST
jgi:hemerythrin